MTTKTPTPQGISALLRKAGFTRSERTGRGGYCSGYRVGKLYTRDGAVRVSHHFWSMGEPVTRHREELARYAEVITAAGYMAEIQNGGRDLIVTAGEEG
jgi:hypothetical protein